MLKENVSFYIFRVKMWMIQRKTKHNSIKNNIKIVSDSINNYLLFQYPRYKWKRFNFNPKDDILHYYSLIETRHEMYQILCKLSIDFTGHTISIEGKLYHNNQPFILQSSPLRVLLINELNRSVQNKKLNGYFKCNISNGEIIISQILSYSKKCFQSTIIIRQQINKNILKIFQVESNSIFPCLQRLDIIKNEENKNIEKFNLYKKIKKHLQYCHYDIELSEKDSVSNFPTNIKFEKRIKNIKCMYKNKVEDKNMNKQLQFYLYMRFAQNQQQQLQFNQFNSQYFSQQININIKNKKNIQDTNFIYNYIKNVKCIQKQQLMFETNKCKLEVANFSFQYCLSYDQEFNNNSARKNNTSQIYQQLVVIKSQIGESNVEKIKHQKQIIKLLNLAQNPNLLRYFQVLDQNSKFNNKIVMEYFQNSVSLANFVILKKQTLSIHTKIHILQNIINGLRFLNYFNITHMDLNMNNILVIDSYNSKIIDFGQSYNKQIINNKKYLPGFTLPFCPPDVFNKNVFGIEEDIFSFGVILYKLIFDSLPFFPTDQLKRNYKYKNYHNIWYFAPEKIQNYGCHWAYQTLLLFFTRCFEANGQLRPIPTWSIVILKQIITLFSI